MTTDPATGSDERDRVERLADGGDSGAGNPPPAGDSPGFDDAEESTDQHPPAVGDEAPDFEALRCDGETFRPARFHESVDGGAVLVFYGFSFSAVAENWWRRYARRDWASFDVPVLGVSRDGPYAQNRFLRTFDLPFSLFADVEGEGATAYDLLVERDGMGPTRTARRAIFVVDGDRTVSYRWVADDWLTPPPVEAVEAAVNEL